MPEADRASLGPLPPVSVIVPVKNAASTLPEQIEALKAQTYPGIWELILVDNGSTDDSMRVMADFACDLDHVRIESAPEVTNAAAVRNTGARVATGDFLAFCDADDVVFANWLEELVAAARAADFVAGSYEERSLNPSRIAHWRPPQSKGPVPIIWGYLPFASSGNLGIWKQAFLSVDGFDEGLTAGEDIDLSWRLQQSGFVIAAASQAIVRLRHRTTLMGLAGQFYGYGRARSVLAGRYDVGKGSLRELGSQVMWLVLRAPYLLTSHRRRGIWVRIAAYTLGQVRGALEPEGRLGPNLRA